MTLLPDQFLEEPDDRLDPAIEIRDVELLIRSVQVVVGQAKAHHHAGNLQYVLEIGDDGNRAAGANEYRVFFEDFMHGLRGGLDEAVVRRYDAGRAFAVDLDFSF